MSRRKGSAPAESSHVLLMDFQESTEGYQVPFSMGWNKSGRGSHSMIFQQKKEKREGKSFQFLSGDGVTAGSQNTKDNFLLFFVFKYFSCVVQFLWISFLRI